VELGERSASWLQQAQQFPRREARHLLLIAIASFKSVWVAMGNSIRPRAIDPRFYGVL
jgi:hypothetical protein